MRAVQNVKEIRNKRWTPYDCIALRSIASHPIPSRRIPSHLIQGFNSQQRTDCLVIIAVIVMVSIVIIAIVFVIIAIILVIILIVITTTTIAFHLRFCLFALHPSLVYRLWRSPLRFRMRALRVLLVAAWMLSISSGHGGGAVAAAAEEEQQQQQLEMKLGSSSSSPSLGWWADKLGGSIDRGSPPSLSLSLVSGGGGDDEESMPLSIPVSPRQMSTSTLRSPVSMREIRYDASCWLTEIEG